MLKEKLMDTNVIVQFRVESCGQLAALPSGHYMFVDGGDGLTGIRESFLYVWCAYECHGYVITDALDVSCGVETSQLSSVSVASHMNVHRTEISLR